MALAAPVVRQAPLKRGPAPKDSARRQRRNLPAATPRGLALAPSTSSEIPALPGRAKEWLLVTRQGWTELWESPLSDHLVESDHPALVRLFQLRDERERAWRSWKSSRIILTEKGGLLNPMLTVANKLDAEIRQLEDRYGLSPAARIKLGLQLGKAAQTLADLNRNLEKDNDDADDPRLVRAEVQQPAQDA